MKSKVIKKMMSILCATVISTSCIIGNVSAGLNNKPSARQKMIEYSKQISAKIIGKSKKAKKPKTKNSLNTNKNSSNTTVKPIKKSKNKILGKVKTENSLNKNISSLETIAESIEEYDEYMVDNNYIDKINNDSLLTTEDFLSIDKSLLDTMEKHIIDECFINTINEDSII